MNFKISVSKYKLQKKIPPGDPVWPRFNASFDNMELNTNDIIDDIYEGKAITTWHKNNWRTSENYICGQHIGLDFDTEDDKSRLSSLKNDKFISKYAAFIHTTISHKPESPRARVIFLLDEPIMQAQNYALAATSLLWLFGTADRQCKDAVRFFYGSPNCEIEILANRLPVEVIKKLIKNYKETGEKEKRKTSNKNYSAPASQQEVYEALKCIPPWGIEYSEWVEILMGIHSAFGESGFLLAENWANGYKGEIEQKWRSFKADGNPSGTITVATVFGIAKRFGWRKSNVDK